jgi:hypothetical protein
LKRHDQGNPSGSTSETEMPRKPEQLPRWFRLWSKVVEWISLECLLTQLHLPNGGSVILLRSLLGSLLAYLILLGIGNLVDSSRTWCFSWPEFLLQVHGSLHWYGAIFGAIYAALYARFSSQWAYLANVYNQIKAAECRGECSADHLDEWKAGLVEDAQELHLALKPLFASVLRAWNTEEVKEKFAKYSPGGEERFVALMARVEIVWERSLRAWER